MTRTVLILALFCLLPLSSVLAARVDFSKAQSALQEKRFQDAVTILTPIIERNRKNGEAHFLLGQAYAGLGQWDNAEKEYRTAIDRKFKDTRAIVGLADALIQLGRADEVAALVEKRLKKVRKPVEAAMLKNARGRAELSLGNYSKAQEWLLGARYDDEGNIRYRADLGNAYYEGQVYPLAATEFEAVLAVDSTNEDIMFKLGEIYYQQRRLNDARKIFVSLLERDSTYDDAYFRLANIYMMAAKSRPLSEAKNLYMAALTLYRKVRVVDPKANPVLVAKNIATVYYLLNAHDSAMVELQRAIDAGATDPELKFYLGRSSMLLGKYRKAVASFIAYRQALEAEDPPHQWTAADAELFWRTAVCMEALKDTTLLPQIAENYRRAVELNPDDERSIGGLALAYHKLHRYAEAAVEFEKLVVKYPNDARHLFNAALPYLQLHNNEKAVEYLLRAAKSDTTSSERYRERGYKLSGPLLIKMQRLREAQMCYKWLVKREPDVCDYYQWYGYTLFALKQYAAAVPELKHAYRCSEKLNTDSCKYNELRWWLAFALYQTGDKDGSYKLCEKVVACKPGHKDAHDLMNRIDEETIEEN